MPSSVRLLVMGRHYPWDWTAEARPATESPTPPPKAARVRPTLIPRRPR